MDSMKRSRALVARLRLAPVLWAMLGVALVMPAGLTGCAARPGMQAYGYGDMESMQMGSGGGGAQPKRKSARMAMSAPPAPSAMMMAEESYSEVSADMAKQIIDPDLLPQEPQQEVAPDARKVHYEALLQFRDPEPAKLLDSAEARALALGGQVERRDAWQVVLGIPSAKFRFAYKDFQGLGKLEEQWLSAADITAAFQETEMRLRLARASAERLKALVAQAQNDDEKLRLLRELQRVSQEIENLAGRQQHLTRLADLGRMTVQAQAPGEVRPLAQAGPKAFRWILQLDPWNRMAVKAGKKLELTCPERMVELEEVKPWTCTSSEGTQLWTRRHENVPRGDARYWREALRLRLAPNYKSADTLTLVPTGEQGADAKKLAKHSWQLLRLVSYGQEPHVWWIATQVHGKKLHMVEVLFPDLAQEVKHKAAVQAVLGQEVKP